MKDYELYHHHVGETEGSSRWDGEGADSVI